MNVFIAEGFGATDRQRVPMLVHQDHRVVAMASTLVIGHMVDEVRPQRSYPM